MVSFEGNTGPYLLYARARINSVFDKAAAEGIEPDPAAPIAIGGDEEKTLALTLLRYPRTVRATAESLEPHRLCAYLYDLAVAFSRFYDRCPILKADDDASRMSRLRLADLTRRVLTDGLETLGLPLIDRM